MASKILISKVEVFSDELFTKTRYILPTLARICLTASFIEDVISMGSDWTMQINVIKREWRCGTFVANIATSLFLVGQLLGCTMILFQRKVSWACGVLLSVIFLQTITYNMSKWNMGGLLDNIALVGALLMVLADSQVETRSLLAGVPTLEKNKPRNLLQLSGRCLVAIMFLTLLESGSSYDFILQNVISTVLMVLIMVGYKTRLSAFVIMVVLIIVNFYEYCWWLKDDVTPYEEDVMKYNFFHTLSVVGGLLMIVVHGPGDLSIDHRKKQ